MHHGLSLRREGRAKRVHFIGFCEEPAACPFSVVVFAWDLKDVGDMRCLEGRVIEIHGPGKLYDSCEEISLNRVSQLTGGSTLIAPCPRTTTWKNRATTAPAACVALRSPRKSNVPQHERQPWE